MAILSSLVTLSIKQPSQENSIVAEIHYYEDEAKTKLKGAVPILKQTRIWNFANDAAPSDCVRYHGQTAGEVQQVIKIP